MTQQNIGVVGAGVMGQNLALNIAGRGFSVAIHDADAAKLERFVRERVGDAPIRAAAGPAELAAALERPRRVLLMVPAGAPVDAAIAALRPHLARGDVIVDGGNSHYADTTRRVAELEAAGLHLIGAGVSGGEEGALHGPAIMPGGAEEAWPCVRPVLQAIAARTPDGDICCEWVGPGGAGHLVKMVHNGIEYGDMQLIAEAYHLLRSAGLSLAAIADAFDTWSHGDLSSYLIEITRDILRHQQPDGTPTLDVILDVAAQKGTGKWTVQMALDFGQPLTLIAEAVLARFLSGLRDERTRAAEVLSGPGEEAIVAHELLRDLPRALYASKLVSYAQGFQLLRAAAREFDWPLNYGGIALLWRAGCIIRSAFLGQIREAYERDAQLPNLLLDPHFADVLGRSQAAWRRVVSAGVRSGVPLPAMGAALAYYDGYRAARLPANLLQAQRDYFGAHTYERVDAPRGQAFHTEWVTGR
jgi:6-phosphogluconate dehydrogenase